jgi:hypothetical protein
MGTPILVLLAGLASLACLGAMALPVLVLKVALAVLARRGPDEGKPEGFPEL